MRKMTGACRRNPQRGRPGKGKSRAARDRAARRGRWSRGDRRLLVEQRDGDDHAQGDETDRQQD